MHSRAHLVKAKTGTEEHAEREPSLLGALFGRIAKPAEKEMEPGMSLDGITRRELVSLINEALKETNGLLVEIAQSIYGGLAPISPTNCGFTGLL